MSTEPITAEDILGAALRREPDAVRRYHLADTLAAEVAPRLRALSAAQLVAEGCSVQEAADAVGVTRQHIDQLLRAHDLPRPRDLPEFEARSAAYRFGQLLALYRQAAEAAGERPVAEFYKMEEVALSGRTLREQWPAVARRWLRRRPESDLLLRIEALEPVLTAISRYLEMPERFQLMLGYHSALRRTDPGDGA